MVMVCNYLPTEDEMNLPTKSMQTFFFQRETCELKKHEFENDTHFVSFEKVYVPF